MFGSKFAATSRSPGNFLGVSKAERSFAIRQASPKVRSASEFATRSPSREQVTKARFISHSIVCLANKKSSP